MFERLLNVSANLSSQDNLDLVLTGVDTVADIYVDGTLVRSVYNAHRCPHPVRTSSYRSPPLNFLALMIKICHGKVPHRMMSHDWLPARLDCPILLEILSHLPRSSACASYSVSRASCNLNCQEPICH